MDEAELGLAVGAEIGLAVGLEAEGAEGDLHTALAIADSVSAIPCEVRSS